MNILENYDENKILSQLTDVSLELEDEELEVNLESDDDFNRKLYIDKSDKSTSDLFRMMLEGELNLQPDFQREFIWDIKTMSIFIESLFLSIPIPTIFLAENDDDTLEVIDGQQRLTTLFAFMKSKFNDIDLDKIKNKSLKDIEPLKLKGLETLKSLNNKMYTDLEKQQRKFNNISLSIVTVKKDSSENIKYDIFTRINKGSKKLNSQELLNVMYRGKMITAINDLAQSSLCDKVFGYRPILKKRYGYDELLLRVLSINEYISTTWELQNAEVLSRESLMKESKKYNGRLNDAIIRFLKLYRNDQEKVNESKDLLAKALKNVDLVFNDKAFVKDFESKRVSLNRTVAELQLTVLSRFSESEVISNKQEIKSSFINFIKNNREDLFTRGTNNTKSVQERYKWGVEVENIIKRHKYGKI